MSEAEIGAEAEGEGEVARAGGRRRPAVYLHIGAPKTGTTYLQSILWKNRDALRADGFLYPGEHHLSHTYAALNLREIHGEFAGYKNPAVPGAWQRLVDEARAWDGPVLVSQELFSPAEPAHIEHAMTTLDFADVHIIFTARDLVRQVPAAWQEDLKNRKTLTFAEFLDALQAPPERMHKLARIFWRMQDAVDVLGRWARDVPPERVHLITLPRRPVRDDTLWTRFCAVTGIDPERYDTASAVANPSLGVTEANLLRRLNLALSDEVRWPMYLEYVTGFVGIDVLGSRPNRPKITLPPEDREWISKRAHAMVDELRAATYHVVGDLDDLALWSDASGEASPSDADGHAAWRHPDEAVDADMVGAAAECMAALVTRLQQRHEDVERAEAEIRQLTAERDSLRHEVERHRETLAKSATKLFVIRLSEQNRAVMRARIMYWNIVTYGRKLVNRLIPGRADGR